jgi:hypothetical protein
MFCKLKALKPELNKGKCVLKRPSMGKRRQESDLKAALTTVLW